MQLIKRLKKLKILAMSSLCILYHSHDTKNSGINIISICTSKRQAIKMAIDRMLINKVISTEEIGEVREGLASDFVEKGYSIQEVKPNTFLN